MTNPQSKVFITGASGFVGRHVVSAFLSQTQHSLVLLENRKRICFDSEEPLKSQQYDKSRITIVQGNLFQVSKEDLSGVSIVIHLAGIVDYNDPVDPSAFFLVN